MDTKIAAIERAVHQHAAQLQPYHTRQVVSALNSREYAQVLDFNEDTERLSAVSVKRALKRLAETEPNLFQAPEAAAELDEGSSFSGKSPGGAASEKTATKEEQLKNEALDRMGVTTQ